MAAGMSELLRSLPEDNPDHPRIMIGYKTMMASLLKYQAENGMWRQLIDDSESWFETSCTGMFTFAMITGVKNGWLDKETYGKAARKGWLAPVSTGYHGRMAGDGQAAGVVVAVERATREITLEIVEAGIEAGKKIMAELIEAYNKEGER